MWLEASYTFGELDEDRIRERFAGKDDSESRLAGKDDTKSRFAGKDDTSRVSRARTTPSPADPVVVIPAVAISRTIPRQPTRTGHRSPGAQECDAVQIAGAVFSSWHPQSASMSRDMGTIKPLHVIIVAVALAAVWWWC
jgi:hypothetical protein